jgi:AraC family L-rhamnose operon regulatory protein RhaS
LRATQDIRDCFEKIGKIVREKNPENNISKLTIYLNEFLLFLLELFRNSSLPLNESLTSAKRSVKIFLADLEENAFVPWNIHAMAQECGVGITSFIHYCKEITNMTPMQYLLSLRIEVACSRLVGSTRVNVLDIAMDCGFSSSQYFANCFKKATGFTPSEYRVNHAGGQ